MKKIKHSLTLQIVIATIGGIVIGSLLGKSAGNLEFIGNIFIRLIQMSVVVLVMTSVISAIGEMALQEKNQEQGLKMGLNTFKWILIFTGIAAVIGYGLAVVVQPGDGMHAANAYKATKIGAVGFSETIENFVSTNIFQSMANGDMIPVIVFSVLFGVALNQQVKQTGSRVVLNNVKEINHIILLIIQLVMKIAPVGIFCLLANVAGTIGLAIMIPMVKYLGILLVGVLLMMLVLTTVTATRCKVNPLVMPKKFVKMSVMALTTTSSAITFPTALEDCVTKFGVKEEIAKFTMSVGMTMGSSGAAMCYVVMLMFMQQSAGIHLSIAKLVIGIGLAVMLTLGTITVPGGSAVVATFLATSVGLPVASIALIIGVDWFAGMFRTFLNVNNDIFVSMLVANSIGEFDRNVYGDEKIAERDGKIVGVNKRTISKA